MMSEGTRLGLSGLTVQLTAEYTLVRVAASSEYHIHCRKLVWQGKIYQTSLGIAVLLDVGIEPAIDFPHSTVI